MASLSEESVLFKELKEKYEKDGDTKTNFFECVELVSKFDKNERGFVLYRLKQLSFKDTGIGIADAAIKILTFLTNQNREYGFYTSVIETSLE